VEFSNVTNNCAVTVLRLPIVTLEDAEHRIESNQINVAKIAISVVTKSTKAKELYE